MNSSMIEVKDFRKTYGNTVAVDGISFDVKPGEIFGLVDLNGAGKTSMLECLEGLRAPSGGMSQPPVWMWRPASSCIA